MATRTCSSCHNNLSKAEYSKNQWTKKDSSKCKRCVTAGDPPPSAPVPVGVTKKDELFVSIGDVHVGDGKKTEKDDVKRSVDEAAAAAE